MWNIPYPCQILMKLEVLNKFSKNIQISNFMTICPAGADLSHSDGGTDGPDEANSCFLKICERA